MLELVALTLCSLSRLHSLLTENEKVRYATLQALDHKKGSKSSGEGCALS